MLDDLAARDHAVPAPGPELPEMLRQRDGEGSKFLAPFRGAIEVVGWLLLLAALLDGCYVLVQASSQAQGDTFAAARQIFLFGIGLSLAALGAGVVYMGRAWMAPGPVPTLREAFRAYSEARPESMKKFLSLDGSWYYGVDFKQHYTVSEGKDGVWRYRETLNGRTFTGALSVRGDWCEANLTDSMGVPVGTICLRREPSGCAVSIIQKPGETEWGQPNRAIGL